MGDGGGPSKWQLGPDPHLGDLDIHTHTNRDTSFVNVCSLVTSWGRLWGRQGEIGTSSLRKEALQFADFGSLLEPLKNDNLPICPIMVLDCSLSSASA